MERLGAEKTFTAKGSLVKESGTAQQKNLKWKSVRQEGGKKGGKVESNWKQVRERVRAR